MLLFDGGLNDEVLKYTNQFRKSKRLPALEMRDDLNEIARRHSDDMATGKRRFGHDGFNQRESEVQKIVQPFSEWPKMLLTVPRQGKKLFKCGKIHQVTGKTCWAIINTWGLEPPLITTGRFILPRYLSGENEIDLISA
jgi:hypothetical protein